ncbi:hypothetical protein, partial [Flavihumibacter sp. ZG627]|uniref:hypothetical protein n=1 Tax=Flavihumibacter sp. ZG627 TaxID=1463156 RepID=UPI00057E2077
MITYHYDLISGKVNMVSYNPGKADQFFHQYDYDAENRLRAVKTSADGWVWEVDATYDYYRHGPLARTELGDLKVQGLDYAYSLQGWLKGVNSTSLYQGAFDMGGDGKAGGIHQYTARDAMGFSLTYFGDDYRPVGPGAEPFAEFSSKLPANQFKPLYNGNITAMAVNISGLNGAQLYNYQYDQLSRLTGMDSYQQFTPSSNQWTSPLTTQQAYKERIAYDGNGNILQYLRQGMATKLAMDSLQYKYNYSATGQLLHNQL